MRTVGIMLKGVGFANSHFCQWKGTPFWGNLAPFKDETAERDLSGMKKPSSKIREEIAKLQDALKAAETREAERIGRIALRAGLGEMEIDETELQVAFEDMAKRFRGGKGHSTGGKRSGGANAQQTAPVPAGTDPSGAAEA